MDDIQREYSARLASGGREIAFSSVQRLRPNGLGPFPGRYHLHGIPDCRSYAVSNAVEGVLFGGKGRGIHPWIGSGFFDGISARGKWFGALSSSHLRNLVWSSFKSARRYDSPSPLDETAACNEPPSRISAPHFSFFFFLFFLRRLYHARFFRTRSNGGVSISRRETISRIWKAKEESGKGGGS